MQLHSAPADLEEETSTGLEQFWQHGNPPTLILLFLRNCPAKQSISKCNNKAEYQLETQQLRRWHLLTALLLCSTLPPEPKAWPGRLADFILHICRSQTTGMSTPVQEPVCSPAFSSGLTDPQLRSPNKPSGTWVDVASPLLHA